MDICEKIDFFITFTEEMIPGCGEDSFCSSMQNNSAMVGVFDGCGGLGATKYPNFQNHTGAYIASRIVSDAVYHWYKSNTNIDYSNESFLNDIKKSISSSYKIISENVKSNSKIKGSMVRELPTTLAIAFMMFSDEDKVTIHNIWCGDSRIYVLNEDGLAQLSRDDVNSQDALSNLSDDGALTNVISADNDYVLHHNTIEIEKPALVFSATDGCFGYFSSPIDFEYLILKDIQNSKNVNEFEENLNRDIKFMTGDDFTLGIISVGFKSFKNLKKILLPRYKYVIDNYINILNKNNHSYDVVFSLWKKYQNNYEKYLITDRGEIN